MAYSTLPKTRRDAVLTLKDGTGSPVTLEIEYEEGNVTFDTPKEAQTVIRDRGVITTIRKGDSRTSGDRIILCFFPTVHRRGGSWIYS